MSQGIYAIRNRKTDEFYVGSSAVVEQRWRTHKNELKDGTHHSFKLQKAWDKFGESNFDFAILENVEDVSILAEREQYWIDYFESCIKGYNVSRTANRPNTLTEYERSTRQAYINEAKQYGVYEPEWIRHIRNQKLLYDEEQQNNWETEYSLLEEKQNYWLMFGWIIRIALLLFAVIQFGMGFWLALLPIILLTSPIVNNKKQELSILKDNEPRKIARDKREELIRQEKEKNKKQRFENSLRKALAKDPNNEFLKDLINHKIKL